MTRIARTKIYVHSRAPRIVPPSLLPPKRAQVLAYIRSELDAGRPFPTAAAISSRVGWKHVASATQTLGLLVGDGHLVRKYDRSSGRARVRFELVEL